MKKVIQHLSAKQPSTTRPAPVRKLDAQMMNHDAPPVLRNLEFYRKAEEELLANSTCCDWEAIRLSPRWAER
jgi:hypothetical protein